MLNVLCVCMYLSFYQSSCTGTGTRYQCQVFIFVPNEVYIFQCLYKVLPSTVWQLRKFSYFATGNTVSEYSQKKKLASNKIFKMITYMQPLCMGSLLMKRIVWSTDCHNLVTRLCSSCRGLWGLEVVWLLLLSGRVMAGQARCPEFESCQLLAFYLPLFPQYI